MISKRMLEKWRKENLKFKEDIKDLKTAKPTIDIIDQNLKMTQILLDQHLMNK